MENKKELSSEQREELLTVLKSRFEKNRDRHQGLDWAPIQAKLEVQPQKLWSLHVMEETGGEPDVIGHDNISGEYIFYDCSAESPKGRRSVCYDREGLESRKEYKPENNAVDMAAAMGIELLTEAQYRELQQLGNFDTKTCPYRLSAKRAPSSFLIAAGVCTQLDVFISKFPTFCSSRYFSSVKSSIPMAAAISIALFFGVYSFLDSCASRS